MKIPMGMRTSTLVVSLIARGVCVSAQTAVLAPPSLVAAAIPSAAAASTPNGLWSGLSAAELRTALPGLDRLVPASASAGPIVRCLGRLLDRSNAAAGLFVSGSPDAQADALRARIAEEIRSLAKSPQAAQNGNAAPLPDQIAALDGVRSSLEDAKTALPYVFPDGSPELAEGLARKSGAVLSRLKKMEENLIQRAINDERIWDAAAWHGRTAVLPLADGGMLALKFKKRGKLDLKREQEGMEQANSAGLETPIPLPVSTASSFPEVKQMKKEGQFLPYLIPKNIASGFFDYLGAELPADFPGDKAAAIRGAAERSMRDMIKLADHGLVHASLAPMSHSEAAWAWDYFRWNFTAGGVSYGPSNVHSWKKGLRFSNLRLSGVADFEHIEPLDVRTVGQNLTEWSLLVMLAGASNGIPVEETADILWSGYKLHAASRIDSADYALDFPRLRSRLSAAARRFYEFHRRSESLPRWIIEAANSLVGSFSVQMIDRGEPLVMSGSTVRALILDVVYPYVTALKGQRPGKWDHLKKIQLQPASRAYLLLSMIAPVAPYALISMWFTALIVGVFAPAHFLLLTPALGLLPFVPRVLQGLYRFLRRAPAPLWIRRHPAEG